MVHIHTAEKIHKEIQRKIANGGSYIDALVEYASEKNIEIETVAEIVRKSVIFKEKIREEATSKRMVKRDDTIKLCE